MNRNLLFFILLNFIFALPAAFGLEKKIRTSDGVDLYVNVKGEGIPCLYIHGGPGSGSYWLEYFSGRMLEQKLKMVYLDQRGVSRSGSPANNDYSLKRMIQDFEEVRESLGIKEWILLAHSFGAGMQTKYAVEHPDVVSGMIMINGTVNIGESLKSTIAYTKERHPDADYKEVENSSEKPMVRMYNCMQILGENSYRLFYKNKAAADTMNKVMGKIENWNYDFGNRVNDYSEYFQDFSTLTAQVKIPVLVISGKSDYAIGVDHYKLMKFPKRELVRLEVGHLPFQEAPDALRNSIYHYLKKYFKA